MTGEPVKLLHSDGSVLVDIGGVAGAVGTIGADTEVGLDRIVMQPGAAFELHTHPGAHILYVLSSRGLIHIDGLDYPIARGDSIFVPADYPHGVKTDPGTDQPLEFVAFGVPHMPIGSPDRMMVME
ncbi:cupin domain-containing protein [Actinoplanes regularis]|uniref:cupin domain-containing protein n=1 Tax=Actinoplanes regularis TaxID=52697 RepID=UPI001943FD44|nr:cupin domain-containing protein [Actinoplanes regularis]